MYQCTQWYISFSLQSDARWLRDKFLVKLFLSMNLTTLKNASSVAMPRLLILTRMKKTASFWCYECEHESVLCTMMKLLEVNNKKNWYEAQGWSISIAWSLCYAKKGHSCSHFMDTLLITISFPFIHRIHCCNNQKVTFIVDLFNKPSSLWLIRPAILAVPSYHCLTNNQY